MQVDPGLDRLLAVFDQTSVAMGLVATDGTWLRFNDRLCELLGSDRDSIAARLPRDLIHPEDRPAAVTATGRLLRGEVGSVDAERRYLRGDGRLLRARVTTSVVCGPDGAPDCLLTQLVAVAGPGAEAAGHLDPGTGVVTAAALTAHVHLAQQRLRRSGGDLVLISADVADLDPDTSRGTRLLACLAQRMTAAVRGSDLVGRTGPQRLSVCCEALTSDADIEVVVGRLAATVSRPVDLAGEVVQVKGRLQVAVAAHDERAHELVTRPVWPAAHDPGPDPSTGSGPGGADVPGQRRGRRARRQVSSSL